MKTLLKYILERSLLDDDLDASLNHGDQIMSTIELDNAIKTIVASKDRTEFKKNTEDFVKQLEKVDIKDVENDGVGIYAIVSKCDISVSNKNMVIGKNLRPFMFALMISSNNPNNSYCFFNTFKAHPYTKELNGPKLYSFGLYTAFNAKYKDAISKLRKNASDIQIYKIPDFAYDLIRSKMTNNSYI